MTDLPRLMRSIRAGSALAWQNATRISIHEAAHGIVQILEGGSITAVSLELGGEWLSANNPLRVVGGVCSGPPSTPAVFMAGRAAEALAFPPRERSDPAFDGDERQLRDLYPDVDRLRAQGDALRLLRGHWPAVCALASLLLERGELDGNEAMFAIRAHLPNEHRDRLRLWGDAPPLPPRQWFDDAADALRAHYSRHGHMSLTDDRNIEDMPELAALSDPKYHPGTPEHAHLQERAAAYLADEVERLEDIFPADLEPEQAEKLETLRGFLGISERVRRG